MTLNEEAAVRNKLYKKDEEIGLIKKMFSTESHKSRRKLKPSSRLTALMGDDDFSVMVSKIR